MKLHGYNNLHRDEEVKNYAQNSAKTDDDEHKKSLPDNRLHKFQQNNSVAYSKALCHTPRPGHKTECNKTIVLWMHLNMM